MHLPLAPHDNVNVLGGVNIDARMSDIADISARDIASLEHNFPDLKGEDICTQQQPYIKRELWAGSSMNGLSPSVVCAETY